MFHLFVAVTSIALVMALTLASIFFGGEAFNKAQEKARLERGQPAVSQPLDTQSTGINRVWTTKETF